MMIGEALAYYVSQLPQREIEIILCKVTHLTRAQIKTWPEKVIQDTVLQEFHQCCQRRIAGEPMAYIFGEREFWSLPLQVNSNVLIPRPETEGIVAYCVAHYSADTYLRCVDIGTGSGAIVLALASQFPHWQFYATDRSYLALQVAFSNARRLNYPKVNFVQADWLTCFQAEALDLIVANPPYIAAGDAHLSQGDLRFEPQQALVAQDSGIADLRQIIEQAIQVLTSQGQLILEHGFEQGAAVRALLQAHGYQAVCTYQDDAGHERFTLGFKQ